ncbi:acetoacetyl-CoA synthetase [Actinomadura sp. NBRC 104412]|uniref:acetoacetate--CoA ligase n=1 Tax=Actinomadura sp. NBRC 104412 TaxID=3032203 RepID=UPI0024A1D714|nr:acetoacetate--CoA ligase [Actinomadura sp. NBRC 104412]GLZ05580.1 acetoacetyl-CoA synthetase [Actinomadura sp. NBRC 104412]
MSIDVQQSASGETRGEILWTPTPESIAASGLGRFLEWAARERGLTFDGYDELWRWSVQDLTGFWGAVWDFFEPIAHSAPERVLADASMPGARWFPGATLNFAENCLRGSDEETVVIARSQTRGPSELTRGELRDAVARAAEGLRKLGVREGDRVAAYLPNIPEAVIAMLATASLGAIWAACAPEFGTRSVLDRFQQIEPVVLLVVDGYRYGTKEIDRRGEVATIRAGLPTVRTTVAVPYLDPEEGGAVGDLTWDALLAEPAPPAYAAVPFDHPLWILFSSGTTGLPKAIVHSHGGIVIEKLKNQSFQADIRPGDRYFVYCTTSWVMWNNVIAALLVGAGIVLMDGSSTHPDDLELWRVIADTGVTTFGCGAAMLMRARRKGHEPGRMFDLSRLRGMLSTGSPLPAEGFRWVYTHVGPDLYMQSGSGGTDVCTGFVGGSPMLPVRAGEIACRNLGVLAEALDADGRPVIGEPGELVISKPMPSMPIYFWKDPGDVRYRETYFSTYPGLWRHGDWVIFDEHGSCRITGRSDGTLNRGGVRLGTSEFYAVLDDVPQIADSMVVHLEDPEGGPGRLVLFVAPAEGAELDEGLREHIAAELRARCSPRHVPDEIIEVPGIPYNITGKKLEIPVKRLLQGLPRAKVVSDGAVSDPALLDVFERLAARFA